MEFTCPCGCEDFHVFMRYKSIHSRFRCKNCNRTYQQDHNEIKEIDLKKMWNEAIKHVALNNDLLNRKENRMSWKNDRCYCDYCEKEITEGQELYSMAARDNWDNVHKECFHNYTISILSASLGIMKSEDEE